MPNALWPTPAIKANHAASDLRHNACTRQRGASVLRRGGRQAGAGRSRHAGKADITAASQANRQNKPAPEGAGDELCVRRTL